MHALEILLNHGYDVSLANSHSLCRWPDGRDTYWFLEPIVLDPFFLKLIARCVDTCPGKFVSSACLRDTDFDD
jgi:hypothetical protein